MASRQRYTGRETLIDKVILELYDPMTHLVNNSITHGIEAQKSVPLKTSLLWAKSPFGLSSRVTKLLSLLPMMELELTWNVKAKTIQTLSPRWRSRCLRGRVQPTVSSGFSTKDQGDDFAGRGVGMDVVRTSLGKIQVRLLSIPP